MPMPTAFPSQMRMYPQMPILKAVTHTVDVCATVAPNPTATFVKDKPKPRIIPCFHPSCCMRICSLLRDSRGCRYLAYQKKSPMQTSTTQAAQPASVKVMYREITCPIYAPNSAVQKPIAFTRILIESGNLIFSLPYAMPVPQLSKLNQSQSSSP